MKTLLPLIILAAMALFSCQPAADPAAEEAAKAKQLIEENLKLATLYHDLNPENIDMLLAEDFKGSGEQGHTWHRESHRIYLSNERYKVDKITRQVAQGDWVCTMFTRTFETIEGDTLVVPAMQFKHFVDGKITEVFEYYDYAEESGE